MNNISEAGYTLLYSYRVTEQTAALKTSAQDKFLMLLGLSALMVCLRLSLLHC